jgi:hypothetical protein
MRVTIPVIPHTAILAGISGIKRHQSFKFKNGGLK